MKYLSRKIWKIFKNGGSNKDFSFFLSFFKRMSFKLTKTFQNTKPDWVRLVHIYCWKLCLHWGFLSKTDTKREIIFKCVLQEFATMACIELFGELMITANRLDSDNIFSGSLQPAFGQIYLVPFGPSLLRSPFITWNGFSHSFLRGNFHQDSWFF